MALKPRMTRSACRICIEALELYAPTLPPDRKEIADETIRNLNYELNRTNIDRAEKRYADAPPVRWVQDEADKDGGDDD